MNAEMSLLDTKREWVNKNQALIVIAFIATLLMIALLSKGISIPLTVSGLSLVLVVGFHFLEVYSRHERFLLDWWIAPLSVFVLVYKNKPLPIFGEISDDLWIAMIAVCGALTLLAMIVNEYEGGPVTKFFDMTTLMVETGLLGILYFAKFTLLPYPTYIPIWIVGLLFAISLFFELIKTPILGFIAIVLGVLAGFVFKIWLIAVTLALVTILVNLFSKEDWVQTRNNTPYPLQIGNVGIILFVPWDNLIIQTFFFAATAFAQHGDAVISVIKIKLP